MPTPEEAYARMQRAVVGLREADDPHEYPDYSIHEVLDAWEELDAVLRKGEQAVPQAWRTDWRASAEAMVRRPAWSDPAYLGMLEAEYDYEARRRETGE